MEERDLEVRFQSHLHARLDDIEPSRELGAGMEQLFATRPRPIGLFDLRARGRFGFGVALSGAAVLVAVILGGTVFRPGLGPGAVAVSPTPTLSTAAREFMILPPTLDRASKPESELAAAVLARRLSALGMANFSSSIGDALEFSVPASGPADDLILRVMSAVGEVAIVPLPASAESTFGVEAGKPLPASLNALFGWDGIDSAIVDTSKPGFNVALSLKPSAAEALRTFAATQPDAQFAIVIDSLVALVRPIGTTPDNQVSISGTADDLALQRTAAVLVGGELPQAWRGGSAVQAIARADAIGRAMQQPGAAGLQTAGLEAAQIDGRWQAVWQVIVQGDFTATCGKPATNGPSCAPATSALVVLDASSGALISAQAPAP